MRQVPKGNYNSLKIYLDKEVYLRVTDCADAMEFTLAPCLQNDNHQPNLVHCDGNECYVEINGPLNVLAKQLVKVVLDFGLKKFVLVRSSSGCTVSGEKDRCLFWQAEGPSDWAWERMMQFSENDFGDESILIIFFKML